MSVDDRTLTQAIRAYQRRHRVSDVEFARAVGTTLSYWRVVKYGRRFPIALARTIYRSIPELRSAALAHLIWMDILPMLQSVGQQEPVTGS